jgi:hypothetical protein
VRSRSRSRRRRGTVVHVQEAMEIAVDLIDELLGHFDRK